MSLLNSLSGIQIAIALVSGLAVFGLTGLLGSLWLRRSKSLPKPRFTSVRHKKRTRQFTNVSKDSASAERRDSLRRKGKFLQVIIADVTTRREIAQGTVMDRSLGGLCLQLEQPLEVDQIVLIRPKDHLSAVSWVKTQIKSCREDDDGFWKVGCAFAETVSWGTMVHFG